MENSSIASGIGGVMLVVTFVITAISCGSHKSSTTPESGKPPAVSQTTEAPQNVPLVLPKVTPYRTLEHFKNVRALIMPANAGQAWVTMAMGITLVIQQLKGRIEGGEGVWDLLVYGFTQEALTIVAVKTNQYGVHVADHVGHKPDASAFAFSAVLRAPIECSSETVNTEARVIIEYIHPDDKDRIREVEITLDDLCVRKLTTRPTVDIKEFLEAR